MDKFESDKNLISRDLATQTQKVVEAKLTIQQLHKLNTQLKSDLQASRGAARASNRPPGGPQPAADEAEQLRVAASGVVARGPTGQGQAGGAGAHLGG